MSDAVHFLQLYVVRRKSDAALRVNISGGRSSGNKRGRWEDTCTVRGGSPATGRHSDSCSAANYDEEGIRLLNERKMPIGGAATVMNVSNPRAGGK